MKFVQKVTWDLPNLEYFKDELEWSVTSMDEVLERIKDWNDSDLITLLGYCDDYECYITDTDEE